MLAGDQPRASRQSRRRASEPFARQRGFWIADNATIHRGAIDRLQATGRTSTRDWPNEHALDPTPPRVVWRHLSKPRGAL
jgi:hypothetical protein